VTILFAPAESRAGTAADDGDATGEDSGGTDASDDGPTGSRGISFATADGVRATVTPADRTTIRLDGGRTSFEPVAGVLDRLDVTARVSLDAAIPVGAGFGASGAATLATAVAADAAFGVEASRDRLVAASHRAEVAAGTGLGDVFVQRAGGIAYDTGDGRARRFPDTSLAYASHGGIATETVLGDDDAMGRIRTAARDAFAAFDPEAPLAETFTVGREFAEATGLVTPRARATLNRVADDGGVGTMAMVGETVVVVGTDALSETTRVAGDGVRLVA
jgi:Predicted archaeal kinase (sugar kinase superfamily)